MANPKMSSSELPPDIKASELPSDVKACARSRRSEILEALLKEKNSRVVEVYPWVADLKDAKIPDATITKAMIETENVTWQPDLPLASPESYAWREAPEREEVCSRLAHTELCAHQAGLTVLPLWRSGAFNSPRPNRDSELFVDKTAQWEDAVFKHCGIGGVLHPQIQPGGNYGLMKAEGDTVSLDYADVSRGRIESPGSTSLLFAPAGRLPLSWVLFWWIWNLPTRIWHMFRPLSPMNPIDWHKHTMHSIRLSDNEPTRILLSFSPRTFQSPLEHEIWDRGLLRYCVAAVKAILLAMADLNQLGGCCNSFPVFTSSKSYGKLSTVDIRFEDILSLAQMLSRPLNSNNPESVLRDEAWRSKICHWIIDMFEKLFGSGEVAIQFLHECISTNGIASYVLHMTALSAQMLSVGLVTYTGGHCSDFYMPHISRTIERFRLLGIGRAGPGILVERVELSCLGDMLQKPVWAFKFHQFPHRTTGLLEMISYSRMAPARYDVEARISQFLDIWDTTIVIDEKPLGRVKLRAGNGFLKISKPWFFLPMWRSPMLHWCSKDDGRGLPISYLDKDITVTVGAITVNEKCSLLRRHCDKELAGTLVDLHREPGHWKPHTRTTGVAGGVGGGPMAPAALTFNHSITQMWCPPIYKKGNTVQQWNENPDPPLTVLNEPWGLEFSLCTGVARRVPLRALLDETVVTYLESKMPNVKLDTSIIKLIRNAKTDSDATKIYKSVAQMDKDKYKALQLAVKHLIGALQWTGLDQTKKNLFLWWPEPDRATDRGVKLDESWYTRGSWIPILQDTQNCAIFGLATWRCLEDSRTGKRCRNPASSDSVDAKILCKKSELILYTGIGPYDSKEPLPVGEYLMIGSRKAERHVFTVRGPAIPESGAYLLEYRGLWSMPAVWYRKVTRCMQESAELIDHGTAALMCHEQR